MLSDRGGCPMTDDRRLEAFFCSVVGHRASALKPDSISGRMNQNDLTGDQHHAMVFFRGRW
jgi:hypothetical protein